MSEKILVEDKQSEIIVENLSIEDWTLLSDHLLSIVKDINAVIGYNSEEHFNLKERATRRVVKGLKEMVLHYSESTLPPENLSSITSKIGDDE